MSIGDLKSVIVKEMGLLVRVKGDDLLISNCRPKSWNRLMSIIGDNGFRVVRWRVYRDINGNIIDQLSLD